MDLIKIAIVAGEPSGDMLAAQLVGAIKDELAERHSGARVELCGVGGVNLTKVGLNSVFPMSVLSIGGYGLDVIAAIPKILYLRHKLIQQILQFKPDVFIGVDAPDFNLYVEKKLKQHGIKTVHYISPTIWAWRYSRIFKIKKAVDLMLCLFPMEEALYKKEHVPAKFIGHHLADEIPLEIDTAEHKKRLSNVDNSRLVIASNPNTFCVLLGSRVSELKNFGRIFLQACNLIHQQVPNAIFLFPLINTRTRDLLQTMLQELKVEFNYKITLNQTRDAICASDLILAKSGTVTLEVALCKKPMIVSYKVSKFTAWLVKRQLKIKYVAQPNILLNEEVTPELLQDAATPENLAKHFVALYNNKNQQQEMVEKFKELHNILRKNASITGAKAVLDLISS